MAVKRNVKRPESNKKDSHLKGEEVYTTEKTPYVINLWGIAGRQEIMGMRRLWQLRIPRK
jgi:hypothetical protein